MEIKPSKKFLLIPTILLAALFAFGNEARAATTYYVDNTTTNCDTSPHANYDPATDTCGSGSYTVYSTIQGAADVVNEGDTVIVADGTYTDNDGDDAILIPKKTGTSNNWITFKAENKWGAVLDGSYNNTNMCIEFGGGIKRYNEINGFDIRGCVYGIGTNYPDHDYVNIINNHIHHIGYTCTGRRGEGIAVGSADVGGGGAWTTHDWLIDGNQFDHIGAPAGCDPLPPTYGGYGIYINGYNQTITNNIFYNFYTWPIDLSRSCDTLYDGTNLKVVNNTFYTPYLVVRAPLILWRRYSCSDEQFNNLYIENNIFFAPTFGAIDAHSGGLGNSTNYIKNNLVHGTPLLIHEFGGTYTHTESGNIIDEDPEYVDAKNNNFHLQTDSPAIDEGLAANAPGYDIEGTLRPQKTDKYPDARFDIGAYEYVSGGGDIIPPAAPSGLTVQ